jgi:hypothetical protein
MMRLRDERYWLGISPWAFVPVFLVVGSGLAALLDPLTPWLRVPAMALLLGIGFAYLQRSPWASRWDRRGLTQAEPDDSIELNAAHVRSSAPEQQ